MSEIKGDDRARLELLYEWLCDPAFELLRRECEAEIYNRQADTLEYAKDWDQVMFNRGWCAALAYVRQLREMTENNLRNQDGEFDNDGSQEAI